MDSCKVLVLFLLGFVSIDADPRDGDVRLVGGEGQSHQGNVQVYHGGKWGAVCDDGWALDNAEVVCKMLGFKGALGHTKHGYFGKVDVNMDYLLDDVRCKGKEKSLSDCEHNDWGQHNCDKREAAGVYCQTNRNYQEVVAPRVSVISPSSTRGRSTNRPSTRPRSSTTSATTSSRSTYSTRQPQATTPRTARPTSPKSGGNRRTTRPHRGRTNRPRTRTPRPIENEIQNDGNFIHDQFSTINEIFDLPRRTTARPSTTKRRQTKKKKQKRKKPSKTTKPKPKPGKPNQPPKKVPKKNPYGPDNIPNYEMRLVGGRSSSEGRLEVQIDGQWGVICSDNWDLREATVACRQLGLHYASTAIQGGFFGGSDMVKLIGGIKCKSHERNLQQCKHKQIGNNVSCNGTDHVAGVICTQYLPDLIPNATLLMSAYLEDRPLPFMECAMEEGCASESAYFIKRNYRHSWTQHSRRLLRFSSSTWNLGTADFRPFKTKGDWEWHQCHMHFHSMEVFAHYDLLNSSHKAVAEGHKASFCLEDVQCQPGYTRRYRCQGQSEQGISVGCADDYLHDIDCQWIDISDVNPGKYIFRVHINPEYKVAELNYDNNAAMCDLHYTGYRVFITNCRLGDLPDEED